MVKKKFQIIRTTARRLGRLVEDLVRSDRGKYAVRYAMLILVMLLAINLLNVLNSYVARDFMSAIEKKDFPMFWGKAALYAMVFVISTVAASLYRFTEERLGILWREQLTWKFTETYLSGRTYYHLESDHEVPNADQRITEDVKAFTTTTLSFILLILNGTITAVSFSGVLWSISPLLLAVAVGYAVLGSVFTILLGKPLIRLNYHQFDLEANFRSDLIHLRENSESIALSNREGRFKDVLRKRIEALASNYRRLIRINRNLAFFTNGYNYFIQIIPALIIAPAFMMGKAEFGVIMQSTMAFATLLGAFSLIVTQFQSISAFTAVTARLHMLTEAIDRAHHDRRGNITIEEFHGRVEYRKLTLKTSDESRILATELSFAIHPGSRWLVTSVDELPKIALFRATAGIWIGGEGKILRPALDEIFFLSERPYLPSGPLRHALLRAGKSDHISDVEIMAVLASLGLDAIVAEAGGLQVSKDWNHEFAIGDQNLLSIARIILARPKFVFLDRPGSALPKSRIAALLELLRQHKIACVLLAKDGESDLEYDRHLEIFPDGSWAITRFDEPSPSDLAGEPG